jgi:hypothetical protein
VSPAERILLGLDPDGFYEALKAKIPAVLLTGASGGLIRELQKDERGQSVDEECDNRASNCSGEPLNE